MTRLPFSPINENSIIFHHFPRWDENETILKISIPIITMKYSADSFGDIIQGNNDGKILVMEVLIDDDDENEHINPFPSFLFFDNTTDFIDSIFREFHDTFREVDELTEIIKFPDGNDDRTFCIHIRGGEFHYKIFKNYEDIKETLKSRFDRVKRTPRPPRKLNSLPQVPSLDPKVIPLADLRS